jgi:hypothetical protein
MAWQVRTAASSWCSHMTTRNLKSWGRQSRPARRFLARDGFARRRIVQLALPLLCCCRPGLGAGVVVWLTTNAWEPRVGSA